MSRDNIIEGKSEDEIWKTIAEQIKTIGNKPYYTAQFDTEKHCVTIHVDIKTDASDDEGPITSFTAQLQDDLSFRFRIEKQNLKHSIRKLFGMQDVIVGRQDFDDKFLIQSNDEARVKELLSASEVSDALMQQPITHFEIKENKIGANKQIVLDLEIKGGITDPQDLEKIYRPFKTVLNTFD